MAPDHDQLLDFARRYTAAWCSQEPASVAAHYSPGGSLTINDGEPSVGGAAITEAALSCMTAFPDLQVLMDDLCVQDAGAEYHWTLIGTNSGSGGTGNAVRISGFEEWTMGEDGLIAESPGHYDQGEYDRQIAAGVTEPCCGTAPAAPPDRLPDCTLICTTARLSRERRRPYTFATAS